jgi:hypothetical protein
MPENCLLTLFVQEMQEFLKTLANALKVLGGALLREGQNGLALGGSSVSFQLFSGAGDGVALFVEELLDEQHAFDVAAAVHALTGAALVGLELREFCLPEAKYVGWELAEFGNFTDPEVDLVRDQDLIGLRFAAPFLGCCAHVVFFASGARTAHKSIRLGNWPTKPELAALSVSAF